PINGLILPFVNLYISLPIRTPLVVPITKANRPKKMILIVSSDNKVAASAEAPTETPKRIVMIYIIELYKVVVIKGTTLLSRIKFPNINIPTNDAAEGISKLTNKVTTIGKMIFSFCDTGRACFITVVLSFSVVNARIIGG